MRTVKLIGLSMLLMVNMAACKYDDSELWNEVNSLGNRVTDIESRLESFNSDINSIKLIVDALQRKVYLNGVTTLENGYMLHFSDGSAITIHDGKDGKDAPVINVQLYNDGKYYWVQTIGGKTSWLYDSYGNMIQASGNDAITPQLKVDSDMFWIISYDEGYTYSRLLDENGRPVKASGKDGDSFFESVEATEDELTIVLKDGTEIVLPIGEVSPYKAVNLGLSVKWASFNLGATASWEQGELYLWGDATNTGAVPTYEAPNMDNICGSKYDIVRSMWGGTWRLPSQGEQVELLKLCSWERVTVNGVKGMKVTGVNGNSIFLPPTGYGMPQDGPIGQTQRYETDNGYYWVGESYADNYGRFAYVFYYNSKSYYYNGSWNANVLKMAIRPVKD